MLNLRAHILVQGLSVSSLVSSAVQVSIGIAPHDPLVRQHARNAIRPGCHNAAPPGRGRNPGGPTRATGAAFAQRDGRPAAGQDRAANARPGPGSADRTGTHPSVRRPHDGRPAQYFLRCDDSLGRMDRLDAPSRTWIRRAAGYNENR